MRVFDVFVNDEKLCRAGVGNDGVLATSVTWVKLTGEAAEEARRSNAPVEETRLHVGGLSNRTHQRWVQRMLTVGDRVTVGWRQPGTATRRVILGSRIGRRTRNASGGTFSG